MSQHIKLLEMVFPTKRLAMKTPPALLGRRGGLSRFQIDGEKSSKWPTGRHILLFLQFPVESRQHAESGTDAFAPLLLYAAIES